MLERSCDAWAFSSYFELAGDLEDRSLMQKMVNGKIAEDSMEIILLWIYFT